MVGEKSTNKQQVCSTEVSVQYNNILLTKIKCEMSIPSYLILLNVYL